MVRGIARAISAAAAAGATVAVFGLMAAGTAGAATRPPPAAYHLRMAGTTATGLAPVLVTNQVAGYATANFENWRFRSVATTVPVARCQINPNTNPAAFLELVGTTTWTAQVAVFCNGGVGSVVFFDQKSATATAQGAFVLSPRTGDQLRITISRNVAGHQDSFTVTNLRTRRSQTVRVTTSTAVVYHHAFLGSSIVGSAQPPLPAARKLLWTYQNSRVVTYGGVVGTLRGPWSTVTVVDRASGGATVMFPGVLSATGAGFSVFLHKA